MADLTLTPAEAALFWTRVDKRGPDECWPWLIGTNEHGYGIFQPGGVTLKAHRVAYWLAAGPFDQALNVLHSCDNPPCCNPRHLRVGTQQDNAADAVRRGRMAKGDAHGMRKHPKRVPRGERNGQAKLTASVVADMRHLHAGGGVSQQALADRYGVSRTQVWRILNGERWAESARA